jgi:hypothetical protein
VKTRSQATLTTGLVLAVVFGSGLLVGAAFDGAWSSEADAAVEPEDAVKQPTEERRTPMYEQVGVTDDQRVVIDSIVVANRTRVRANRAAYDSTYRVIVEETRAAIKDVMEPEQRDRYDSLLAENDARRAAREAEREGGEGRD